MESRNAINWFEIPVSDFNRAKKFYETLFDFQMPEMDMDGAKMGILLHDQEGGKVGGAIVHNPSMYKPNGDGTLVYLNAQPDLQLVIDKVEKAGGRIYVPKTPIGGDMGYFAIIADTEGNRVGLHSMS